MSEILSDAVLLSRTEKTHDGKKIGMLQLNRPKALNALNLDLILALKAQLESWRQDDDLVAIWLEGNERALCAGGDIRALQQTVTEAHTPEQALHQAADFFKHEYGLYADMANYPKPIVTWCGGIVMGGGLGLTAASAIRIVTETTQMAMPEISIGLFPDAGANWFLQKFPFKSGVFLGLTGARFNGSDAILGNLAEFGFAQKDKDLVFQTLLQANWQKEEALVAIKSALLALPKINLPDSHIMAHQDTIMDVVQQATFQDALKVVLEKREESAWLESAAVFVENGCATSASLHWELMQRCRVLSLQETLAWEHTVATHCVTRHDFLEGVRSLLIDKDKNPKWIKQSHEIDDQWLASFFEPLAPRH